MVAYCREVCRLEERFNDLELNHIPQRDNEAADTLAKMALGQTTVLTCVFSTDLFEPTVRYNEAYPRGRQPSDTSLMTLDPVSVVEAMDLLTDPVDD